MSHPLRIHRAHRFERLPPGAILVARPSRWGNPYRLIEHGGEFTPEEAVWLYKHEHLHSSPDLVAQLPNIANKLLACYCPLDQPCHGDVLARMANPTVAGVDA